MDQNQKSLFAIKEILSNNPGYTYSYEQNNDGTYKVSYKKLFFKDKNSVIYEGGIIIPKCNLHITFDTIYNNKFSEPVIESIFPVGENGELFNVYVLDEDGDSNDKE